MKGKNVFGTISAFGTYILIAFIAYYFGALNLALKETWMLVSGGVQQISHTHTVFLMMFPLILAVVVMELPCTIAAAVFQSKLLGKSTGHAVGDAFGTMTEGNHFFTFFILVLGEELFARWLFLGLLPKVSFLSGTVAFYVLFLLGNGIWALVHLSNFKEKDKQPLRVLPQFVAGIFFTYIFVKYGLLAVVLAHFASNAIVFALHKIQKVDLIDGLIVGYSALVAGVSYWLMDKPISDILMWFGDNPQFALDGWMFWDYVKVSVFITSCSVVLFGALFYDRGDAGKNQKATQNAGLMAYAIGLCIIVGILYGLYALMGLFVGSVPHRVLAVAILFSFLHKASSGSAISRTFWTGLPDIYITMCVLQALSFKAALGYVAVSSVIGIPKLILARLDD